MTDLQAPGRAGPPPESELPGEIPVPEGGFSLPELVDMALRYHPSTRRVWAATRAAEEAAQEARGSYYPAVGLEAEVSRVDGILPLFPSKIEETYVQTGASLSYLLFDFGGRTSQVEGARRALQAANWEYDQNLQDVVLGVSRSYYALIGALAGLAASEESLREAETNLASAEARLRAGLGTVTDVLLLRAQRAQRVLARVRWQGEVSTTRGALAHAAGLPANLTLPVAALREEPLFPVYRGKVEELIVRALRQRPDLGAAWARLGQAQSDADRASSRLWPAVHLVAEVGWMTGDGFFDQDFSIDGMHYQAGLGVRYPLFEGFSLSHAVRRSQAVAEEARASLRGRQESVILQVWDSYQRLVTAGQRVQASVDLLESAQTSYTAALAAYRAGLTSITELVQAQTTLSDARFEQVDARTAWHLSVVQLARDSGSISVSGEPTNSVSRVSGRARPGPSRSREKGTAREEWRGSRE
jgi:outer membrane protein TolC